MAASKFLNILENIGKDIVKGIEAVAPIIDKYEPAIAPIISALEIIFQQYEKSGVTLSSEQISQITQAISIVSSISQHQFTLTPAATKE